MVALTKGSVYWAGILFVAQRDHGIDASGAPRGDNACGQCNQREQDGDGQKCHRIAMVDAYEEICHRSGKCPCGQQTHAYANSYQSEPLARDELQDVVASSSECHANPDLMRSLADRIGNYPVNANDCQH